MKLRPDEKDTLYTLLKIFAFAIVVLLAAIFLDGCGGGYRSAMVPLDPAPPHRIELLGNPEELTITPVQRPMWKRILYFGTVGH